jgi:uncharacterized protein
MSRDRIGMTESSYPPSAIRYPLSASMNIHLSPIEARVIGCLIEKAITTPDQYPLSLNALTNACNQKSNREPVLDLDERIVQETVDALVKKHLVLEKSGFGSRVPKYQHRFCNTGFGSLEFSPQETAVVCELLLRGAQTPGELRARASRMSEIRDVGEVEATLAHLASRADGPFVVRLAREPGRRESRYAHLFSGEVDWAPTAEAEAVRGGKPPASAAEAEGSLESRLDRLEALVTQLQAEVDRLKGG